ncbi:MAG: methyltransferase domain-containing protein [Leptolyngbyaceae cyanobacterium bins.349]|nr:methyltransferase domain-containing protein [Leptolyngbyaceae cyanobacterium bins.349]
MGFTLETVVPWGRSRSEYIRMFDLTASDLPRSLLDCAAGPASFNAEMTQQGNTVISCDPLYQFGVEDIAQRIEATYPVILQGLAANLDQFVWTDITTPEQLGAVRMAAMQQFLRDFPVGKQSGRYVTAELPNLPFADQQFDLALCSHFLFAYSDQLGWGFHQQAIAELCRIAKEVRIFPLLKISGERSPFVEPLQTDLCHLGYQVQIRTVAYEFQKGGNQVMQVCSNG